MIIEDDNGGTVTIRGGEVVRTSSDCPDCGSDLGAGHCRSDCPQGAEEPACDLRVHERDEDDFEDETEESIREFLTGMCEEGELGQTRSYKEAMVMTSNEGFELTLPNGQVFQITVVGGNRR